MGAKLATGGRGRSMEEKGGGGMHVKGGGAGRSWGGGGGGGISCILCIPVNGGLLAKRWGHWQRGPIPHAPKGRYLGPDFMGGRRREAASRLGLTGSAGMRDMTPGIAAMFSSAVIMLSLYLSSSSVFSATLDCAILARKLARME